MTCISANSDMVGGEMEGLVLLITLNVQPLLNLQILLPHQVLFEAKLTLR
jgi:hypothetical protein